MYQFPKVKLLRHNGAPTVYARVTHGGIRYKWNTGETSEAAARKAATEWYLKLLAGQYVLDGTAATLPTQRPRPTFKAAYESFVKRAENLRKVKPGQIKTYRDKSNLLQSDEYVIDGKRLATMALTDVTTEWLEGLRAKRHASTHIVDSLGRSRERKEPVSNATLRKDFDFIRLVLNHAKERDRTITELPVFPSSKGTCGPCRITGVPPSRQRFGRS